MFNSRYLVATLFSLIMFAVNSLGADSVRFSSNRFQPSGNYFASISIGGGVSVDATEKLEKTLADFFTSSKGGYYKQVMRLSDGSLDEFGDRVSIDKDQLRREFLALKRKLEARKRTNPKDPVRLVLSLTGHGTYHPVSDSYEFAINRYDHITGKELIEIIKLLPADELYMFVQSCQSGSIVNDRMAEYISKELEQDLAFNKEKRKIAVITPVNRFINSPIYVYESFIRSALSKAADVSRNNVISWGEFKAAMMIETAKSDQYIPSSLTKLFYEQNGGAPFSLGGIDPQFSEFGITDESPMTLTPEGSLGVRGGAFKPISVKNKRTVLVKKQLDKAKQTLKKAEGEVLEIGNEMIAIFKKQDEYALEDYVYRAYRYKDLKNRRIKNILQRMGVTPSMFGSDCSRALSDHK